MGIAKSKKSVNNSRRANEIVRVLLYGIIAGTIIYLALVVNNQPNIIALPVALVIAIIIVIIVEYFKQGLAFFSACIIGVGLGVLIKSNWAPDVSALGIGFISLGIGGLAMNISLKSDKRVTAIADMQFYEKMAVIQTYLKAFNPDDSDKYYADKIFYDLKAAKRLEKQVSSPKIAEMLNIEIQNLINKIPPEQKWEYLRSRLNEVKDGKEMNFETDEKEVTLKDIKQEIESIKSEMKRESRLTGLTTLFALAATLIVFGIGLFFQQRLPTTYDTWFFIILGIVLGIFAWVFYSKSETPKKNKESRDS